MMAHRAHPLDPLEVRLRTILPEEYQDTYQEVQPVSMGSAGLKFDADGRVAWNDMWASFCDLAMAGGPPHKGALLEPGSPATITVQPAQHAEVVDEICRGIWMVSDLEAGPAPDAGWVRVACESGVMADWMRRAIVMENVSARAEGRALDLPAAPAYRLDKEIKNVVTVVAKTSHYWLGHMWPDQQQAIGTLFEELAENHRLIVPLDANGDVDLALRQHSAALKLAEAVRRETGLLRSHRHVAGGWIGFECETVPAAVSMMRLIVVCNVLARREETVLCVPVNAVQDADGVLTAAAVARVHRLVSARTS